MKLIVAIVHSEDAGALVAGLLEKDFRATRLNSAGGFLRQSNATVLVGVEDGRVDDVLAIVHNEDAANLVDALLEREYRATRLQSSGGFLKQGNATILVGVEDDEVDAVLELISANCHSRKQFVNPMPPIMEPGEFYMPYPVEVEVGGATVFVMPVERFERL